MDFLQKAERHLKILELFLWDLMALGGFERISKLSVTKSSCIPELHGNY